MNQILKVGILVNPIAGCGQLFNLKGSDSLTLRDCPRSISLEKAVEFLEEIKDLKINFLTASGKMGEEAFQTVGIRDYSLIYSYTGECTSDDTVAASKMMLQEGADILVFFGGDGTARNIVDSGFNRPVLGIPLGTKMFSSVFAINIARGVQMLRMMATGNMPDFIRSDVIDLNEASYERGEMELSSYGTLLIPKSDLIMSESKAEYPATSSEAIGQYIIDGMEDEVNYLIGPGSTCKAINSLLELDSSLLGFDLVRNKTLLGKDLSESEIFKLSGEKTKIVLSPIGGQGFLLGRGNKQLSTRILSRVGFENIIVVASEEKLMYLKGLYVDIWDSEKIAKPKYIKVLFSYGRFKLMPVIF